MAEEHAHRIALAVVGQVAEVSGYDRAHRHALDAVADVMMRFTQELGIYAKEAAELQRRTDVNALDVASAINQFGMSCEGLLEFAQAEPADAFPHSVSKFPVRMDALQPPPMTTSKPEARPAHIPGHLPAFPDIHTRNFTPIKKHETQTEAAANVAEAVAAQQQDAQATLIKLHQRMQERAPEGRKNPFLAFASDQGADAAESDARNSGAQAALRAAFEPIFAAEAAAAADEGQQQDWHQAGGDVDMLAEDTEHLHMPGGAGAEAIGGQRWRATTVEAGGANALPSVPLFYQKIASARANLVPGGDVGAAQAHTPAHGEDAFAKYDGAGDEAGGRRRANAYSADKLKHRKAQNMLESGPDAVLMEYPEGFVQRQGQ